MERVALEEHLQQAPQALLDGLVREEARDLRPECPRDFRLLRRAFVEEKSCRRMDRLQDVRYFTLFSLFLNKLYY